DFPLNINRASPRLPRIVSPQSCKPISRTARRGSFRSIRHVKGLRPLCGSHGRALDGRLALATSLARGMASHSRGGNHSERGQPVYISPTGGDMQTLAEICGAAVAFSHRSIDRLVLTAYIPTLQTPGAMATFFREVCKKPILSGLVFK